MYKTNKMLVIHITRICMRIWSSRQLGNLLGSLWAVYCGIGASLESGRCSGRVLRKCTRGVRNQSTWCRHSCRSSLSNSSISSNSRINNIGLSRGSSTRPRPWRRGSSTRGSVLNSLPAPHLRIWCGVHLFRLQKACRWRFLWGWCQLTMMVDWMTSFRRGGVQRTRVCVNQGRR